VTSHDDLKGEGFEVIGHAEPKSHEGAEEEEMAAPAEEPEGEAPEPPTEETADTTEPLTAIDVHSVLRISIAQLAGVAWQMMGLQPDPFTNEIRKDTAQARIAIDAAAALVELLKPHIQGQEARDYQNLLTDLRMNFVSHSTDEKG
jgi:hypothetical protein